MVTAFDIGLTAFFCAAERAGADFKTVMGVVRCDDGLPLPIIVFGVRRRKSVAHCRPDIVDCHTFPIDKGTLVRIPDFIDSVGFVFCKEFIEIGCVLVFAQKLLDKLKIIKVVHTACDMLQAKRRNRSRRVKTE